MKRVLVTIILFLHFVASSGLLLSHHFCGGEYVTTKLDLSQGVVAKEMCNGCSAEDESEEGCCEEKLQFIKKTIDLQSNDHQVWDFLLHPFDLPIKQICFNYIRFSLFSSVQKVTWRIQKPPPKGIPRYLQICCFRI